MPQQIGNVVKVPGTSSVAEVRAAEILYSYAKFTQKGVTLRGNFGLLPGGQALGRITASKLFGPYSDAASDGREVCRGFLRQPVETGTDANVRFAGNIVVSGIVRRSKLTGVDAAALADLNAREDIPMDYISF